MPSASEIEDLPSGRAALWRSLKLGFAAEPALLGVSLAMVVITAAPDALLALWLKLLVSSALDHHRSGIVVACVGLGSCSAGSWLLTVLADRIHRRFRERATVYLETHVARLQATVPGVEHQERPEYLDRLSVLRDQVFALNHLYLALFTTLGALIRLAIVVGLLMTVHPALVVLALAAVPAVAVSTWRAGVEEKAHEAAAADNRRSRHLFTLATTPGPAKELRVSGSRDRIAALRQDSWSRWYASLAAARWPSAAWLTLAWGVFAAAFVGAVVFVASGLDAPPADVLLVLAAGSRLAEYVGTAEGEANFLRMWLESSRRLAWLEDYATAHADGADLAVPESLGTGIAFEGVSFRYPGTERLVLEDVDLELPAGSVVALVGENGAGKSTLVKLLARMYEPTSGTITVNGVPLHRLKADDWRGRMAGAFQDFFRFEFLAQRTVGLGDLSRLDERDAALVAVGHAGADDVVARLPSGLDTQLGPTWDQGVELSFGQWQKLALARGLMRGNPLVLVLDEPTAALDAETEHALFERFAAQARSPEAAGRVTILVSHRFSTVRMADTIVVLDGSRVVEVGSHAALMEADGHYAGLYRLQASAYQ